MDLSESDLSLSQSQSTLTRTVAIIKHHALDHRLEIEPRILEAGFEIIKENPMDFDTTTDPEVLVELFGEADARSLEEGPVWVYVLERRRAVEVWITLMGDRDPEIARQESPHSLRALYGISLAQNGFMGSPDLATAEVQIASLFQSSPLPLPEDLPFDDLTVSDPEQDSLMDSLRRTTSHGTTGSINTSRSNLSSDGKRSGFRARALPETHVTPDIAPRMTKASALRAGYILSDYDGKPKKVPQTKEQRVKAFMDVPGHKRSSTIAVASTAAPVVAPRMTRAAALRLGIKQPEKPKPVPKVSGRESLSSFDGVPGHKRRESIAVASTATPAVLPRSNRSASLRQSRDGAPPTSFQFKPPTVSKVSGNGMSSQSPSRAPSRAKSVSSVSSPARAPVPRPPSVIGGPSIPVRTNKSAALRAAKDEAGKKAAPRRSTVFL